MLNSLHLHTHRLQQGGRGREGGREEGGRREEGRGRRGREGREEREGGREEGREVVVSAEKLLLIDLLFQFRHRIFFWLERVAPEPGRQRIHMKWPQNERERRGRE